MITKNNIEFRRDFLASLLSNFIKLLGFALSLVFITLGATASAVGERLLLLSKNTQVLVVTHSPQVTAKATMHWNVAKSENSQYSKTILRNLDDDQRKEEIARMLSGEKITEEARAAAEKLIFGGGNVNN